MSDELTVRGKFIETRRQRIDFAECPICYALTFGQPKLKLHMLQAHDWAVKP